MKRWPFHIVYLVVALSIFSVFGDPQSVSAQGGGPQMIGIPPANLVCIKSTLPFVWVRAAPSSTARVLLTLYPSDYLRLTTTRLEQSDGSQYWLKVNAFPSRTRFISGWVEESAFSQEICATIPTPSNAPAHPNLVGVLCVNPAVPFVWERSAPSSRAPIGATLRSSDPCFSGSLPGMISEQTYFWDGAQWWVMVGHPPREFSSRAWIEAKSLIVSPRQS